MVHRVTELPEAESRGRLLVPESVVASTRQALQRSCGADGIRHEGLVFWVGRRSGEDALVGAAICPLTDHGPYRVITPETEVGRMARSARAFGLVLVAQVHSHPGEDTRHSEGDDHLIVMPHEGMFSLVVASFGDGDIRPERGAGLHQFQDHRWVRILPMTTAGALIVIPTVVERLR